MNLQELGESTVEGYFDSGFLTIGQDETVSKLISVFQESGAYEVLVSDGTKPGLVTVRDLLQTEHPDRTSVSTIASYPPKVSVRTTVADAAKWMVENRIRTLPVVDKGRLIGGLSQVSIIRVAKICREIQNSPAEKVMVAKLITGSPKTSAAQARHLMVVNGISHLPIVDEYGRTAGLLTARDLATTFVKPGERVSVRGLKPERIRKWSAMIEGLYDGNPKRVSPSSPLTEVTGHLIKENVGAVLAEENSVLRGIITPRDVLKLLKDAVKQSAPKFRLLGVDKVPIEEQDLARKKLERLVFKAQRILEDFQELIVDVKATRKAGLRQLFEARGKIYTPNELLVASAEAWSMADVIDRLSDRLEKQFRP